MARPGERLRWRGRKRVNKRQRQLQPRYSLLMTTALIYVRSVVGDAYGVSVYRFIGVRQQESSQSLCEDTGNTKPLVTVFLNECLRCRWCARVNSQRQR